MKHRDFELGLTQIREGLEHYARAHREAYQSPIGQDYVLGPRWLDIAAGLVGLLDGERGRLDGGDFDRSIRNLARQNGFSATEADTLESDPS